MNNPLSIPSARVLSSKPGVTCFFTFLKNSCKNLILKLSTTAPEEWVEMPDSENTNSSGLLTLLYDVIPLNPLAHPVKELVVIPVYVIISLSI